MNGTTEPAVSRLYLDTNIFIYAIETTGPLADAIVRLFAHWPTQDPPLLCTSELSLAELLVKPLARQDERRIGVYDGWILNSDSIEVREIDRAVLWTSATIRSQYPTLRLPDAIHLATALHCDCSHFLTDDRSIKDEYTIQSMRFGSSFGSKSISILRPTMDVLTKISAKSSQ